MSSLTSVVMRPWRLRFSGQESFFSMAFAHSFLNAFSTVSAQVTGYVEGGLNFRQLLKMSWTSFANSSM
jgi:hypothetical protein